MFDTLELKGLIAKKGLSQRRMARLLGITEKTFYAKMRDGMFWASEIETMAKILGISNAEIGILFCYETVDQERNSYGKDN